MPGGIVPPPCITIPPPLSLALVSHLARERARGAGVPKIKIYLRLRMLQSITTQIAGRDAARAWASASHCSGLAVTKSAEAGNSSKPLALQNLSQYASALLALLSGEGPLLSC